MPKINARSLVCLILVCGVCAVLTRDDHPTLSFCIAIGNLVLHHLFCIVYKDIERFCQTFGWIILIEIGVLVIPSVVIVVEAFH